MAGIKNDNNENEKINSNFDNIFLKISHSIETNAKKGLNHYEVKLDTFFEKYNEINVIYLETLIVTKLEQLGFVVSGFDKVKDYGFIVNW